MTEDERDLLLLLTQCMILLVPNPGKRAELAKLADCINKAAPAGGSNGR